MTPIDEQVVSRKTPNDGRLEISAQAAARLEALGTGLRVASDGLESAARIHAMACTCAKGEGSGHRHYFIESELLRALVPNTSVRVAMDDARPNLVRIERVCSQR